MKFTFHHARTVDGADLQDRPSFPQTTGALLWILLHLAQHPKVQDKLRGELVAAAKDSEESGEESMSLESLESLPYLDSVIVSPHRLSQSS